LPDDDLTYLLLERRRKLLKVLDLAVDVDHRAVSPWK
jgi:hypothetical protein